MLLERGRLTSINLSDLYVMNPCTNSDDLPDELVAGNSRES